MSTNVLRRPLPAVLSWLRVFASLMLMSQPSLLGSVPSDADSLGSCSPEKRPRILRVALRTDDVFMAESRVQPQEIDSLMAVVERHSAKMQFAVIPHRLLEPRNADGEMAKALRRYAARGHSISQHGWNHRHEPSGSTAGEFSDPRTGEWLPYDTVVTTIARGKELLERTIGYPVDTYVSPGDDDQLHPLSLRVLRELGFRWVTGAGITEPLWTDSINYLPDMPEFTWALADTNYNAMLDSAKGHILRTIEAGSYWSHCYHDHFTRYAWNAGIVARWTDELLSWMEHLPDIRIEYVTVQDLRNPGQRK